MPVEEQISSLPDQPGVYIFRDKNGAVLYVGKAINLKKRVRSYFLKSAKTHPRIKLLVSEIASLRVMLAPSEVEALLLERTLIRQHKPPYNVLFRDDKEYPLIRVDLTQKWPRIEKVRRRKKNDPACYLGPFSQTGSLNKVLEAVFSAFPLIRCSVHEFQSAKRPCNYYHMKKCLGPCTLPVDPEVYRQMIYDAIDVIKGKNREVRERLQRKMAEASGQTKFEEAALFRDQIKALNDLQTRQYMVVHEMDQADILGYAGDEKSASFQVMYVRDHHVWGHDFFHLSLSFQSQHEALGQFILRYYETRDLPSLILAPFLPENCDLIRKVFQDQGFLLKVPTRVYEKKLMAMAIKNASFHHKEQIRKNQSGLFVLKQLKESLTLSKMPVHIECIDISHFQGTATVASLVCFRNGKPDSRGYRLYNLEAEAGKPDDFQSIREVVKRRISRGIKDGDLPDLLLIDGGKGQLSAALEACQEFSTERPELAGIAKSRPHTPEGGASVTTHPEERVFRPGVKKPLVLETGSALYRLLTTLRDEAHRFAIAHHRSRRQKIRHQSGLLQIKGVGPVLRNRLLSEYGSLEKIAAARPEDLTKIKGISEVLAISILDHLQKTSG